jgi:tRNA-dihydrouridine synthase A
MPHMPTTTNVETSWRFCVAPMMDWTDRHCRYFHRLLAPGARLYTEMVHANAVLHGDAARLLDFHQAEHPVALQLGGSEPEVLARASTRAMDWGYDEVNLNVGCPSDRVQSGRFGACLMREPALVADCVAAMVSAVSVPVTVKCRIGVDDQQPQAALFAMAQSVRAAGAAALIVHARKAWLQGLSPKENREVPPLDYPQVYALKRAFPEWPIIINGGITAVGPALEHLQHVDGVMLGRSAYHTPYVLHELDVALGGVESGPLPRGELLLRMRDYCDEAMARGVAVKHILRHVLGLFHAEPGGRLFRQILSEGAHRADADWQVVERALAATVPARCAA